MVEFDPNDRVKKQVARVPKQVVVLKPRKPLRRPFPLRDDDGRTVNYAEREPHNAVNVVRVVKQVRADVKKKPVKQNKIRLPLQNEMPVHPLVPHRNLVVQLPRQHPPLKPLQNGQILLNGKPAPKVRPLVRVVPPKRRRTRRFVPLLKHKQLQF